MTGPTFDDLAAADGLQPGPTAEQLQAAEAEAIAEGPAAQWPWGSGTEDDPYYTPDDYVFGTPVEDYLAAHPEGDK